MFEQIPGIEPEIKFAISRLIEKISEYENILFYLPAKRHYENSNPLLTDDDDLKRFDELLDSIDSHLVIKLHPAESKPESTNTSNLENITLISANLDVYPLLKQADVLITDYSSVYLDFLPLDRPLVFFPYDFDSFSEDRSIFFDYDAITPGPKVETAGELWRELKKAVNDPIYYETERNEVRRSYFEYEGGGAAEHIYQELS